MRGKYSWYRACALSLCLALLSAAAPLVGEDQPPDLSLLTMAELVSRALAISKQLEPGLIAQSEGWESLNSENMQLREDLQKARLELVQLKSELELRSNESTASAEELSEARSALKTISALIGSSSESWKSSIEEVDRTLKEAAMKQRRAELRAWLGGSAALAATVWALVEIGLRKAGK